MGFDCSAFACPASASFLIWKNSNTYHGVRVRLADQLLLHELGFFFAGGWVGEGGLESGQRKEARKGELHGDQGSDLDD
jgi:hypothetical protein